MWMTLSCALAFAGEPHAGIPVGVVPILGDTTFLASGWRAPIRESAGGEVRVFVAHEELSAQAWLTTEAVRLERQDRALSGDLSTAALVRDENVAVSVLRPGGQARELADELLLAIEDGVPWPAPPMVHVEGLRVTVDGVWAALRVSPAPSLIGRAGEEPAPITAGLRGIILEEPSSSGIVRVWDRFGRSSEGRWP